MASTDETCGICCVLLLIGLFLIFVYQAISTNWSSIVLSFQNFYEDFKVIGAAILIIIIVGISLVHSIGFAGRKNQAWKERLINKLREGNHELEISFPYISYGRMHQIRNIQSQIYGYIQSNILIPQIDYYKGLSALKKARQLAILNSEELEKITEIPINELNSIQNLLDYRSIFKNSNKFVRWGAIRSIIETKNVFFIPSLLSVYKNKDEDKELKKEARRSMKLIIRSSKHIHGKDGLYCYDCLRRYDWYLLQLRILLIYRFFTCKKCHSNAHHFSGVKKVIALVDNKVSEKFIHSNGFLYVNYAQINFIPFEFDELYIKDYNETDIEKIVMNIKNCQIKNLKKKFPKIPVRIDKRISLEDFNRLHESFGKITQI